MMKKKEYLPPTMEVHVLELENGISASSTIIVPSNTNVQAEWETGQDVNSTIDL